jgi:MarR family transcriptional regulator, organic hydroperoxide resistance regulator
MQEHTCAGRVPHGARLSRWRRRRSVQTLAMQQSTAHWYNRELSHPLLFPMTKPLTLQRELHQSRPFRSAAEEASLGILRTAGMIRRALARVVEPSGITPAQYNVLRILRGAGEAGLPTLAVRDRLLEEAPGITRLVDKLDFGGYLRRARSTPDRRQVICFITPKGLALLQRLDPRIAEADEFGAIGLKLHEQRALIKLLDRVRAAMRHAKAHG